MTRVVAPGQEAWVFQRRGLRILLHLDVPRGKNVQAGSGLLARAKAEFKERARDKNGYLDRKEAQGSSLFGPLFTVMDKDGDGQLFEKQALEYLAPWAEFRDLADRSCVSLSESEEERPSWLAQESRAALLLGPRRLPDKDDSPRLSAARCLRVGWPDV